jgi:hypothetical protein
MLKDGKKMQTSFNFPQHLFLTSFRGVMLTGFIKYFLSSLQILAHPTVLHMAVRY